MRKLSVLAILLSLVAAACAPAAPPAAVPTEAPVAREAGPELAPELFVFNWAEYIDEDLITRYEEEFGVRIIYDTYDSNEDLLAKLQAGATGYDVIFPSDYMVAQMIELGLLAPLDLNNIPNFQYVAEMNKNPAYDPGNKYSVPYFWGTTGIGYDASVVDPPPESWAWVFDPDVACQFKDAGINVLDDQRELIGAALKYLGYSVNEADEAHLAQARDLIVKAKPCWKTFDSSGYIDNLLVPGEVALSHAWNGDVFVAAAKHAFVVAPDVELEPTIEAVAYAALINAGQVCTSTERVYAPDHLASRFAESLADYVRGLHLGPGIAPQTDMGPMIGDQYRAKVEDHVEDARTRGAKILTGGRRPSQFQRGYFYEPTVLVNVDHSMKIMREETFGPTIPIMTYSDFDEAIRLVNDSPFGLGAVCRTNDARLAKKFFEEVKAGTVWINDPLTDNYAGPFGGMKMSGTARELGEEGLYGFMDTKHVHWDFSGERKEYWYPYH